jgi:acetyl esterase/lipase
MGYPGSFYLYQKINPVMNKHILLLVLVLCCRQAQAQEVIPLPSVPTPADICWHTPERQYHSQIWNTEVITNVASPTLTVYRPDPAVATGVGLIIAPGGGFHALSINSEGIDVAKWCMEQGITAFLLKYRLVPSGEDGVLEFMQKMEKPDSTDKSTARLVALAKADGLAAMAYVRQHAAAWNLDPGRIGIMGFSAGGTVAAATVFEYASAAERPDFAAPIYPYMGGVNTAALPAGPMPLFIAVTSDDVFGFQTQCLDLYRQWNEARQPVELHIYDQGGHGFGMRRQGLPSDKWIEAFWGWLQAGGWLKR